MKKICIIVFFCVISIPTMACDICGCGIGGTYIGILPDFSNKVFGLRYRNNSLRTHIGAGGATTYLTTNETYQTMEAWGGWNITPKFRLMASAPVGFNQRKNANETHRKTGIGDAVASAYYRLLDSRKTIFGNKLLVQTLWIGGGIKLPTGQYNPADKANTSQNANLFQLGTGGFDFTVQAMYDIRLQDAGLNVTANYKMNTVNKYDYKYGNKWNSAAQVYHKFKIKKFTLSPNAGALYEVAAKDIDSQFNVDVSGGNMFLATVGVETVIKKISIGANWQTPFSQNLANGFVKANNRAMVHLSIIL